MRLGFSDPYTMDLVGKEENFEALTQAVAQVCGKDDIKIKLQLGTPAPPSAEAGSEPPPTPNKKAGKKASASEDEILRDALDVFGGTVIR